ncbi:MAG: hypothetical protein IJ728_14395 [Selenomonadaceae bacterium]|nr:hypothetical protein [Selenomonadaceae bacterium]MBR1730702.1 hypothetical protein [Selenomonadaceae bacterium]
MLQKPKILEMQQSIKDYVQRKLPKDKNNAVTGILNGNRVIINNKAYPYQITIDDYIEDGDNVCCILPNSGSIAAIVGKM